MNGHTPDLSLYPLDQETLRLVVQYDPFYRAYVDVLALLHDLVCEFADSAEKPRLTAEEINAQRSRVISSLYADSIRYNPEALLRNIADNFDLGLNIRANAEGRESADERFQAEKVETQFLNSLLQTYTTLRVLKENREPVR